MVPVTNPARLSDNANYPGLLEAIQAAGHGAVCYSGKLVGWYTDDAAATQTIIDGYNPVPSAQASKIAELAAAYANAIVQPVAYMGTTFQADLISQDTLNKTLAAITPGGATPAGFYWVDAVNNQVAMTLAQLQGLAGAMMANGWAAFQNLQTKKASVLAATSVSAVNGVGW